MKGSEKQIAWATEIRAAFAAACDDRQARFQKSLVRARRPGKENPEIENALLKSMKAQQLVADWVLSSDDANFYITYRDYLNENAAKVLLMPHHGAEIAAYLEPYGLTIEDALD